MAQDSIGSHQSPILLFRLRINAPCGSDPTGQSWSADQNQALGYLDTLSLRIRRQERKESSLFRKEIRRADPRLIMGTGGHPYIHRKVAQCDATLGNPSSCCDVTWEVMGFHQIRAMSNARKMQVHSTQSVRRKTCTKKISTTQVWELYNIRWTDFTVRWRPDTGGKSIFLNTYWKIK